MEVIVKRVSSSLTYIGQFCRQNDAVESFETVKNTNGQYKKSFESTDFLAFHFLKNNLDTVPYYLQFLLPNWFAFYLCEYVQTVLLSVHKY